MHATDLSSSDHFTLYFHHKIVSFSTSALPHTPLFLTWPQNIFFFSYHSLVTLFCLHLETTLLIAAFAHSTNTSKSSLVFGFSGPEFSPSPGHYQRNHPRGYLELVGAKSGKQKKHRLLHAICSPLCHINFTSSHGF